MIERYYIAAFWGKRKETPSECGQRAAGFFKNLATLDPVFSHWYEQGYSITEALERRVAFEPEALEKLFLAGQARDDDGNLMEGLGSLIMLWNGIDRGEGAMVTIDCGTYDTTTSLLNRCLLKLPYEGPAADRILQPDPMAEILATVVRHWEPDWAAVTTGQMREMQDRSASEPIVGWLTYLSPSRGVLPILPLGCEVMEAGGVEGIIIANDTPLSINNPGHMDRLQYLRQNLKDAGLLEPIAQYSAST